MLCYVCILFHLLKMLHTSKIFFFKKPIVTFLSNHASLETKKKVLCQMMLVINISLLIMFKNLRSKPVDFHFRQLLSAGTASTPCSSSSELLQGFSDTCCSRRSQLSFVSANSI